MSPEQEKALSGSELLKQLIADVNGPEYTKEGRIWNESSERMRTMLWNLANLNSLKHNTKFKADWLQLPNDIKKELRGAIQELHVFVTKCEGQL